MIETYLESKKHEIIELLEILVNTDSGTYNKEGVDAVGEILIEKFEEIGMEVKVHPEQKLGNHLEIKALSDSDPKIMIIAHMDTVFPKGEAKKRPFNVIGNKAFGPGVNDEKASHVQVLYALKALKEAGSDAYKNVHIIFNSDEEIGSPASKPLIKQVAENKQYSIVVECSRPNGGIVTERKGVGHFTLVVKGKSAHAGVEPERGRSAIEEISHKILKLQELNDYEEGISVNVGYVHGGTSTNTIPSAAKAEIDVRYKNEQQAAEIVRKITEISQKEHVSGTSTKLKGDISRPPMQKTNETEQLINVIQEVAAEIDISIREVSSGGGSDASFTAIEGIPTVDGMGPMGEFSHSEKDEYTDLKTFPKFTALLAKTIEKLSG
ncbi:MULTISPECIES: M20 family metallopeptidase [Metabacillus]|uniref:Carboxypeptidase n=1 Tax=Metabacillus litoralis TaxID=152268 RepID=A0A179T620_9BACI|nr:MULTISPECIES: M20 family metallopeptidase [Metabacillus]OAS89074.1 carboxypeptidase [Metabacillus litoralis]